LETFQDADSDRLCPGRAAEDCCSSSSSLSAIGSPHGCPSSLPSPLVGGSYPSTPPGVPALCLSSLLSSISTDSTGYAYPADARLATRGKVVPFFHPALEEPDPIDEEDLELFRHFSEGEDTAEASVKRRRQSVIRALTRKRTMVTPATTMAAEEQKDSPFPWVRRVSAQQQLKDNTAQTTISAKLTYAAYNYVPDGNGRMKRERATGFAPENFAERRSRELVRIRRGVGTRNISKKPKSLMRARLPELGKYTMKKRFFKCMMCKNMSWRSMKKHMRCKNHQLVVVSKAALPLEEMIVSPSAGAEKFKRLKWTNVSFSGR
jgi:hypothetical protein